jgi:hypothetical protein
MAFQPTFDLSRPREATFHASIGTAEHPAFFVTPDYHFAAVWAWKLDRAFARENRAGTPSASRHANDFL